MRRALPRSFFGQLILSTVVVQTLSLVLFIWYTVFAQEKGAEERARQRISQQLDRLSEACAADLAKNDFQSLQMALDLSRIAPTIDVARVTDLSGGTIAVSSNGRARGLDSFELAVLPTAGQRQIFRIRNNQVESVTPLKVGGKTLALLWLEPDYTHAVSTADIVVRIAMTYGGLALLANILPIFLIVRTMTKPLLTLRAATDRVVRDPELSAGFPLPVTIRNEAGSLTVSFNSMVRELQKQRRGLLETLALLDSMLRNAPVGFAFFDRDLRYVRVNDFLAVLHGLPIDQHLGRRPDDVYPESVGKPKLEYLRRVFESGAAIRNVQLSGEMVDAPGLQRSWMMHFYPVSAAEGVISWVGVVVVEITDQLRAEEALRKTEKLAITGRLAASIAHEINNPLEAVTNLLYLLQTHEALDEESAGYVAAAQSELSRVSEITQQTLRFYKQATSPGMVNVRELLESIALLFQPRIKTASVRMTTKFRGEPMVFGFGGELRQMCANLIGNALDAMPRGGCLRLSAHRGHGRDVDGMWRTGVWVFVGDSGSGMSEETRRRIFEPFFTTKEATGTGLGLWVTEEIVRKHSGTIRARSRQGEKSGTIFVTFLPDPEPQVA